MDAVLLNKLPQSMRVKIGKLSDIFWDVVLRALALLVRCLVRMFVPVRIVGAEKLKPHATFIVASNHVSALDPPLLVAFLAPYCLRLLAPLATKGLFVFPLTLIFKGLQAVPIDRQTGDNFSSIRQCLRIVHARPLLIFPEGRRSSDGSLLPAMPGVGFLAVKAKVPVFPVAILGTEKILPKGKKQLRRAPLAIVVGDALDFSHLSLENDTRSVYGDVSVQVMAAIENLKQQAQALSDTLS